MTRDDSIDPAMEPGQITLDQWSEITGRVKAIELGEHLMIELSTGAIILDPLPEDSKIIQSALRENIGSTVSVLRTNEGYRLLSNHGETVTEIKG